MTEIAPFLKSWETLQLLGRGGWGDVHEVRTDKGIRCAAKTLRLPVQLGKQLDSRDVQKFLQGERNLCRLRHGNIVTFLHMAQPKPETVVVFMEMLDGCNLEIFLDNRPLDEGTIQKFSIQIISALVYMHNQIEPVIHRDINCTNTFVLVDEEQIKLIDFGLSIKLKQSVTHISTLSETPKGTLNFMAPELLGAGESDSVQYSRKSDIWAFGCSVFQMATGGRPFAEHRNPFTLPERMRSSGAPALPDSCSPELQDFYRCCTQRDRRERKSAVELEGHKFLDAARSYYTLYVYRILVLHI